MGSAEVNRLQVPYMLTPSIIPHPSWIEIDLKQFKENIRHVKNHIGKSLYCLPIKANAYGHGLSIIAKEAEEAGVDYLAVAHLQEGIKLREAKIELPILVLGAIHEDQIADLVQYDLEFTISSKYKAVLAAKKCQELQKPCKVHIEIDTGMQRTGVRLSSAMALIDYVKAEPYFKLIGIYSHLATADKPEDPFAIYQIESFIRLAQDVASKENSCIFHLSNSGGIAHFPESLLQMVRPALITFGYGFKNLPESLKEIAPCFSLKSKVAYFKVVEAGTGISYGHSYVTKKQTRIVTIPIGYGDGYRRSLSNKGSVLIRGKRFPIVGTICMDQFMVDIGEEEVYVGDEVVLIGKQGNQEISLQEVADLCETIPYEVLCFFNDRIPRYYLK